jgi:hypothetical protein
MLSANEIEEIPEFFAALRNLKVLFLNSEFTHVIKSRGHAHELIERK